MSGLAQVRLRDTHTGSRDTEGSPDVFANGLPIHRKGDADTCGKQAEASTRAFANGRGRARVTDKNTCLEPEMTGSPNVFLM